ncbi:hypothetical protein [Paenibacillus sp. NRS-1760]|uniref:hypothetical protein n=1 Tax=Paenibacillus sp. NRS-1760 TaxID=3233902 RepID=UPI003D278FB7
MSISKRGRPRLRHALFIATIALIMNDETIKRQHEVNIKTKSMKPMRSVMKLCGKLARILVAIARRGEAYEPNRNLPMKQIAYWLYAPHKNWLIRRISRLHGVPDCIKQTVSKENKVLD